MTTTYDVLILGAGAAGLACARDLYQKSPNSNMTILEARSQPGGRIRTLYSPHNVPMELGAEFMHGASPEILHLAEKFALPFYDVCDHHLFLKNGRLKKIPKFFEQLDKLMPAKDSARDKTIELYLHRKKLSATWRDLFRTFVEGFHGADLDIMGIRGLASAMETEESDLNGCEIFRFTGGYDLLIKGLTESLDPTSFRFCTQVEAIDWSKGRVHVQCRSMKTGKKVSYEARKLVVTLPIGVLKDSSIQWDPLPEAMSLALSGLEMGHVQRLVFQFRERFWENISKSEPVTFLHGGPHFYFPTWWTCAPLRTPRLVAWQGGPKAFEMRDWNKEKIKYVALKTLAQLSGRSRPFLEKKLVGVYSHNWSQDPFSLGAYSYVREGGFEGARILSKPVERTLYFAGEGTCLGSSRGTVHGAIRSGKRVAAAIKDV